MVLQKSEIIRNSKEDELFVQCANIVMTEINRLALEKEYITLGLVGGRSVAKIYELLSKKKSKSWMKVQFFLVDERNVPNNDSESNFLLMQVHLTNELLARKQISINNIHPIIKNIDPNLATKQYALELEKYGDCFDIVVLSSGEDNHVGAIFPQKKYSAVEKFTYFNDSPKLPKERFTATPKLLSMSKLGIVIFLGASKKNALNHFLDESSKKTIPEKVLQKIEKLIILTDQQ
ncbi:MAG: 6-phosphogluconolactonase [Candidatus Woesearchaeota archaeon]